MAHASDACPTPRAGERGRARTQRASAALALLLVGTDAAGMRRGGGTSDAVGDQAHVSVRTPGVALYGWGACAVVWPWRVRVPLPVGLVRARVQGGVEALAFVPSAGAREGRATGDRDARDRPAACVAVLGRSRRSRVRLCRRAVRAASELGLAGWYGA